MTQFGLGAQPNSGPLVQIDPAIVNDLTSARNTAQAAIGNTEEEILNRLSSEANKMKNNLLIDAGVPMDFNLEAPGWIYWYSDKVMFDYNPAGGAYTLQVHDTYSNPSPAGAYSSDEIEVTGILSRSSNGVETFEITTSREMHSSDNSKTNSWVLQFAQTGEEDPTFVLDRNCSDGPSTFGAHLQVQNGQLTWAEMAATHNAGPLRVSVGYRLAAAVEVLDGSLTYSLPDKLEINAAYKKDFHVGQLAQGGLVYRFNDDNYLKSYFGLKNFDDPAAADLSVAGGELSFKIVDSEEKYLNGSWGDSGIADFVIQLLPRRVVGFFTLKTEMQAQQESLRNQLNMFGAELDLSY